MPDPDAIRRLLQELEGQPVTRERWKAFLRVAFRGEPEDFERLFALYVRGERDL